MDRNKICEAGQAVISALSEFDLDPFEEMVVLGDVIAAGGKSAAVTHHIKKKSTEEFVDGFIDVLHEILKSSGGDEDE